MIEPLESRITPAGNVAVSLAGGLLTITGDSAANKLTFSELSPGQYTLAPDDGETFTFNGEPAAVIVVSGLTKPVKINLGEGNDDLNITNSRVPVGLDLQLGAGDDSVTFTDAAFAGKMKIQGGIGADTVTAGGQAFQVGGPLEVLLGDGNGTVTLAATSNVIGGNLKAVAGTGTYDFTLGANAGTSAVGGSVTFQGSGKNTAHFSLNGDRVDIGSDLIVNLPTFVGGQSDVTFLKGAVAIGGKFKATLGAGDNWLKTNLGTAGIPKLTINGGIELNAPAGTNRMDLPAFDLSLGPIKATLGPDSGLYLRGANTFSVAGSVKIAGTGSVQVIGIGSVNGPVTVAASNFRVNEDTTANLNLTFSGPVNLTLAAAQVGDSCNINYATIGGPLTVTGKGSANFNMNDSLVAGALTLKLSKGRAVIGIDSLPMSGILDFPGATRILGPAKIELGKTDDLLTFSGADAKTRAFFSSSVLIKRGGGTDTITTTNTTFATGQPVIV